MEIKLLDDNEIFLLEKKNSGTSKTKNKIFETNGYLVVKDLIQPSDFFYKVPEKRGTYDYRSSNFIDYEGFECSYSENELQVNGSTARYFHPHYKYFHSQIRMKIEKIIGEKLYNTYYYDRFYFYNQSLKKHVDRDACEISATVHISSNIKNDWPIWIKTPDKYYDGMIIRQGKEVPVSLDAGDGLIYKGCERPHWRDIIPISKKTIYNNITKEEEEAYYHQIFFHYVLANGLRTQFAYDYN